MIERNCDHCVSPMMAVNIVSHGSAFAFTASAHMPRALKWAFEPYDKESFAWRDFRKRVAKALANKPNKLLEVDWVQTYKANFPEEWKEIEDDAIKYRSEPAVRDNSQSTDNRSMA